MLRRLPIESTQPVVFFAGVRVALVCVAALLALVLDIPKESLTLLVVAGGGLPWTLGVLLLARRQPMAALNPLVAVGDFGLLVLLEVLVPEMYGPVRFTALFLVAVHAHFQGERRGLPVAVLAVVALVVPTAINDVEPPHGALLAFYDTVFAATALGTAVIVGRLRTTESASRLRARELSRRTIQAESEVRRRVAESIHDGPVQELIGLDMMLSALGRADEAGDREQLRELLGEARELTSRNVTMLREEIVDLGPYAFEELGFGTALEKCIPIWKRRYGFEVMASIERVELPPEVAGDLFRITQEAVVNAGRHAEADAVSISLRSLEGQVELRITDNGRGFDVQGAGMPAQPGHLGLASMRERAELLNGGIRIESSELGTKVVVLSPLLGT